MGRDDEMYLKID